MASSASSGVMFLQVCPITTPSSPSKITRPADGGITTCPPWPIRDVSALLAKSGAYVGVVFTLVALLTGAIWGKPMWGAYWAWDPRLTSFLILFLFYLGYLALWAAIDDPDTAAGLSSVLCMIGSVFALLSRYAVNFWNQGLHQGASLSLDKEEHVADVFWQPCLTSAPMGPISCI